MALKHTILNSATRWLVPVWSITVREIWLWAVTLIRHVFTENSAFSRGFKSIPISSSFSIWVSTLTKKFLKFVIVAPWKVWIRSWWGRPLSTSSKDPMRVLVSTSLSLRNFLSWSSTSLVSERLDEPAIRRCLTGKSKRRWFSFVDTEINPLLRRWSLRGCF